MKRLIGLAVLGLVVACQPAEPEKIVDDTPLYYQVGNIRKDVTTSSEDAQLWFNRGLGLAYGFNHEEAIVCFELAIEAENLGFVATRCLGGGRGELV